MSTALVLRPATAADAQAMVEVHHAAVHRSAASHCPEAVLQAWSPGLTVERLERMRAAVEAASEAMVVAVLGNRIVGFGSVIAATNELRALYVHPDAARRRVGKALLSKLEEMASAAGAAHLEMDASLNAEAFYSRSGCSIVERTAHRLRCRNRRAVR